MSDEIEGLIEVLFDSTAREDERDDAASYLGKYNDSRALNALVKIASNPNENDTVVGTCGESIAQILVQQGEYRKDIIAGLVPTAQDEALAVVRVRKPHWLKPGNIKPNPGKKTQW